MVIETARSPMELHLRKGAFHKWLGKDTSEPLTAKDIKRGLASDDPHVRKMANFAKNARKWHHASVSEVTDTKALEMKILARLERNL